MEDYKEECLMVWVIYMSPCNSIVGLYFKDIFNIISVTMATCKVHKNVLQFSVFVNYLKNLFTYLPFLFSSILNRFKENMLYGLQKMLLDNFP